MMVFVALSSEPFGRVAGDHYVGVMPHRFLHAMAQCDKKALRALATGKLHGGNKITVARHKHNERRQFFQAQAGHVEADAHVDALLIDDRLDVIGPQRETFFGGFAKIVLWKTGSR